MVVVHSCEDLDVGGIVDDEDGLGLTFDSELRLLEGSPALVEVICQLSVIVVHSSEDLIVGGTVDDEDGLGLTLEASCVTSPPDPGNPSEVDIPGLDPSVDLRSILATLVADAS